METLHPTIQIALYAGDQLDKAVAASRVDGADLRVKTSATVRLVRRLAGEIRNLKWDSLAVRSCIVEGREVTSQKMLRIGFRASPQVRDFCAQHILGTSAYTIYRDTAGDRRQNVDLRIDYNPYRLPLYRSNRHIHVPARVSQFLPLRSSWAETLNLLPQHHQKELRRHLRQRRFDVRLSKGPAAIREFYRTVFVPYALARFGRQASVETEAGFVTKHQDSCVLWLYDGNNLKGANLLLLKGDSLFIEHCGLYGTGRPENGLFDVLDYFSLLLAQLVGCRELDFGGTRAHLDDGVLRYKAKWGARIRPPDSFARCIRLRVARNTAAVRGFLRRNLFLQLVNERLKVKVLIDPQSLESEWLSQLTERARSSGLNETVFVSVQPKTAVATVSRESHSRVTWAPRNADLVARYMECQ